jgi:hypothetical protein
LFLAEELPKESSAETTLSQTIQAKIQSLKEDTSYQPASQTELTEEAKSKFSIYNDECYFIAPNVIITPAPIRVLTLKFSLEKFVSQHTSLGRFMISLINRENNKPVLMQLV